MKLKKIAILTSRQSWFLDYSNLLRKKLKQKNYDVNLIFSHHHIRKDTDVVFILSYFKLIPKEFLNRSKYNIVVHESDLPKGKGWAPLAWQILKGKNKIPVVLFEANEKMDGGNIYIKDFMHFQGHELYDEVRKKQALKTIELCCSFLKKHQHIKPIKQKGHATYYPKRNPEDSEIDANKTIKSQFNLLRVVDNANFPAYFYNRGHRYTLYIERETRENVDE
jgi:methionyl-tRNA formyltransferase